MKESISVGGNVITYVLAAIQTNEVLQIVEFVMSAILTAVILGYRIWHWWVEAHQDGKITKDEIDELGQIIEEETKDKGAKK